MTGEELRNWRKAMAYGSQAAAAEALGVSIRTYQRFELHGKADLPPMVGLATEALAMRKAWNGLRPQLKAFGQLVRDH
jgi:DNA-binding XRE family transcriptional regulator